MREWFLSAELVELDGMPNNVNGISLKARRNKWLKRKAVGNGRSMEYHISSFHEKIQKQLIEKYGTLPESNVSEIQPLETIEKWCKLPVYNVHAAAGAGSLVESEHQIGVQMIPCDWLSIYGLDEETASVIFVEGDSMDPTLNDKDRLLVDIRERPHPVSDGVYVISIDGAVYVKRLRWDIEGGVYEVISDNPKHKNFQINHNNGRHFKIIGKAVTTLMKDIL
ncbi:peptidase [Vibrio coralliilyticus]|uniref:helix-turn-helix domain-containing protein n=1 Tax=Vibrio coralliilyticus TaxID=190893 RepID=UPI0009C35D4D|nr:S24 family peptidase [Vibrio coralliilyticus]ARC90961.1 peptidase [Vibrio coralliilyticus]NOI31742.1 peptidase [Vibrio coralliilyticus]NOI51091.1 peptidase [Vibrio coralliilyticus]NOI59822.1 peptidase [Vibrio coralliilyticus]PAT65900.1 peptidase [Vibrio coralliilyticus]